MKNSGEVGARIRRLRRAAGMSQAELAGDGLSASYISLLEAGKRVPSADVLDQLAARLGCDPADLSGAPPEVSANEFQVELNYAEMALNNGDPDAAFEAYRSLQDKISLADRPEVWYKAEYGMARSLEHGGRLEEAVTRYEYLHAASLDRPDMVPRLPTVIALCRCYRELGDLSHAIEVAEATLAELEKLQLRPTVIGIELLSTLVGVYMERGDMHRAAYLATQAIEQAGTVTDSRALGAAYWNASVVMHRNGNTADALTLIEKALAIYGEGEDQRALARLRNAYAMLLLQSETAKPEVARDVLEQSLTSLREVGSSIDIAYCLSALAQVELRLGNAEAAIGHAERALELLGPDHRLQSARNHLVLAAARLALGDRESAQDAYERGALMLEASEANRQAAFAWAELAEILKLCGEDERAVWAYRQSMRCMGHRETFLTGRKLTSRT
ncbi:helix-turn-helix domain-containing protein [Streptomyces sp. HM190]|uniref:helix-turn-helix domain-containing protein n=1 Tax=Streptomyces sp. HM190 TaxID=2695266 RepID=UPI001F2847F2|nr:helix-turn-helix transcriptional regulator [Streptomyces sp. HM190]